MYQSTSQTFPLMWTQPSDVLSANENSDTPLVTALLSKDQGSADGGWNCITERSVAPSHSSRLGAGSWSSQDVCSGSRGAAGCVLCCLCSVRCGEQGEGVPAEVRRGGHPAYVPVLAGILGLQHQHHEGELRQAGEHSETFLKYIWWSCCTLTPVFWRVSFHSTQSEEGQIWGNFYTNMSDESRQFPIEQINDTEIKLQLISLQDKGAGALSVDKAAHVRLIFILFG